MIIVVCSIEKSVEFVTKRNHRYKCHLYIISEVLINTIQTSLMYQIVYLSFKKKLEKNKMYSLLTKAGPIITFSEK